MMQIWVKACLALSFIIISLTPTNAQLRADQMKGFKLCPGNQLGHILSVEVDGPGCYRRNGRVQWPCFLYPGRTGVYRVSFTHDLPEALPTVKSSIHVVAQYRGPLGFTGVHRLPYSKEVNKNACPAIGCPVMPGAVKLIEKKFTVPGAVRMMQQNMKIEFKLTTGKRNDILICFIVPAINQ